MKLFISARDRCGRSERLGLLEAFHFFARPSMYSIHLEHHARTVYSTSEDGEYIPWGVMLPIHILLFPLVSLSRLFFLAFLPLCGPGPDNVVGPRPAPLASAMCICSRDSWVLLAFNA